LDLFILLEFNKLLTTIHQKSFDMKKEKIMAYRQLV